VNDLPADSVRYRLLRLKILVVDDYDPFRRLVCAALQDMAGTHAITQSADGLDAVTKAEALQPEIVLLDVGLPTIDGLEAARRIRTVAPDARIVFISVESDQEVIEEAFRSGANGYVRKPLASSDLIHAVEAVVNGDTFLSGGLALDPARGDRRHEVVFHSNDGALVDSFGRFVARSLRADGSAIVMGTRSHNEALAKWLKTVGIDADETARQGRYFPLDADDILSHIVVNGTPDRTRFGARLEKTMRAACDCASRAHGRVSICGECVGLLCAERNLDGAIELEQLGNELLKTHDVDILCGYALRDCRSEDRAMARICAEHTVARVP